MNSCYGGCLFAFILTGNLKYINSTFLPPGVTSVLIKNTLEPVSSLNPKPGLEAELHILSHLTFPAELSHISGSENILVCKS